MPTGWTMGLAQGESDKIIWSCVHDGERSEAGAKPWPRGLCDYCRTEKDRLEMHQENLAVNPNWKCRVCVAKLK